MGADNSAPVRGRPFQPGVSPNPGGRSKADHEIKALAQQHGPDAIAKLKTIMDGDDPKASVSAANALLDRGYGKPHQSIGVGQEPELAPLVVRLETGEVIELPDADSTAIGESSPGA